MTTINNYQFKLTQQNFKHIVIDVNVALSGCNALMPSQSVWFSASDTIIISLTH